MICAAAYCPAPVICRRRGRSADLQIQYRAYIRHYDDLHDDPISTRDSSSSPTRPAAAHDELQDCTLSDRYCNDRSGICCWRCRGSGADDESYRQRSHRSSSGAAAATRRSSSSSAPIWNRCYRTGPRQRHYAISYTNPISSCDKRARRCY